jgi:CHAT domain-containing protein
MGLTQEVENLPALTSVQDEVNGITTQTGLKGKAYLDDAFTRVALTGALNQEYNVLHLATHFVFAPGRPDASRLFLGDRSTLYLSDIAREKLNFKRFALVTFSACESGLGGGLDVDGREMESLGALVQLQGAQAVMATLWKVEDTSTADLMKNFYRARHDDKLGKAAALRSAQLKFINRGGVRSRPYYWAPFVLMGDWR